MQQRIPLGGRVALDVIAEVFNVFNRGELRRDGAGEQCELREPASGQYRTGQLGFRLTF